MKYNIKNEHIVGRPLYLDAQATTPLVNIFSRMVESDKHLYILIL